MKLCDRSYDFQCQRLVDIRMHRRSFSVYVCSVSHSALRCVSVLQASEHALRKMHLKVSRTGCQHITIMQKRERYVGNEKGREWARQRQSIGLKNPSIWNWKYYSWMNALWPFFSYSDYVKCICLSLSYPSASKSQTHHWGQEECDWQAGLRCQTE